MHHLRAYKPTPALVISLIALLIALGGVASATIPDSSGTIHACYNEDNQGGVGANARLRVIDPSGSGDSASCKEGEASVSWNSGEGFGSDTGNAIPSKNSPLCTIGQVTLSASRNVGTGGLAANGQLVQIADFPELHLVIGTTYGGNGTTNFRLPDLRSVAPNHMTYFVCAQGVFPIPN
jgi:hypothetical protein